MTPYWEIVAGLPTTLALSASALLLGAVAAVPLLLARRSSLLVLWLPARALNDVLRAVPPIVWMFVIFFGLAETGVNLTPFTAAMVGLGVISAAYLAEAYRGGLMSVDQGQWEATQALALSSRDRYRYVLGPQAFRAALPAVTTYAIALIKDTALAYTIGVNEVLFRANREAQLGSAPALNILAFAGVLYIGLSLATAYVGRRLDAKVRTTAVRG